jgi:hypothetical protein
MKREQPRRPSPESTAALRAENVPTALVEGRVTGIWAWGDGARLRGHDVAQRARRCAKSRAGWAS